MLRPEFRRRRSTYRAGALFGGLALALAAFAVMLVGGRLAGAQATTTVCPAGPPTCDFTIIQDALDDAVDGETIDVGAGTYSESIENSDASRSRATALRRSSAASRSTATTAAR